MPTAESDLIALLEEEDAAIKGLLIEFGRREERAGDGQVLRGEIRKEIVHRCAIQDAVKEEMLLPLLAETGHPDLAESMAENSRQRRELLADLAEHEAGVSPRYIMVSGGEEFDRGVEHLTALLEDHHRYEQEQVMPVLRGEVSSERRKELAAELRKSRGRADPHPLVNQPLATERSKLSRKAHAVISKLRDVGDRANHDLSRP